MSTIPYYCSHCGAANGPLSRHCFACHQALDVQEERELLNGRYQLLTQVGSGGFGGVYRAIDTTEPTCIVAVKQINLRGLSVQEAIEATDGFNREGPSLPITNIKRRSKLWPLRQWIIV